MSTFYKITVHKANKKLKLSLLNLNVQDRSASFLKAQMILLLMPEQLSISADRPTVLTFLYSRRRWTHPGIADDGPTMQFSDSAMATILADSPTLAYFVQMVPPFLIVLMHVWMTIQPVFFY